MRIVRVPGYFWGGRAIGLLVLAVGLGGAGLTKGGAEVDLPRGTVMPGKNASADLQYTSRTWQTDEGLPYNLVQSLAQTRDGYLWVGTHEGLARFDGVQFTSFNTNTTPELKNSSITALCADRQGTLWIGTEGGGLVCLKNGIFSRYHKPDGLAGDSVRALHEGHDGAIWIGTASGMSRYKDGKFLNFNRRQGLLSDIISSIYEDHAGTLWIATAGGLNRLQKGKAVEAFPGAQGLPRSPVRGICQDEEGNLWFGSNNGAVRCKDGMLAYFGAGAGLAHSFVCAFCKDRRGNLWVGTYGGLDRFRTERFSGELREEGLPYDQVNAIIEDREENLWVGSKEGLIRLSPKRFFAYTIREGLTHNNIMSVREDRAGSLWIGTWGGGLNQWKDGKVTVYAATNGLSHDLVLSTCEGRDGSIWVGTDFDGGLNRLKDGKLTYYKASQGLINAAVRVIQEDQSGNLWAGTSRGLSCLKDGKFINYTTKENLAGDLVRAICEDREGTLWFGTDGGLSRWRNGKFTNFTIKDGLSRNMVAAIYEDAERDLWLGTQGGGLNRLRGGKFTSYTTREGLFSDDVFEILEDDFGYLWMSCLKGIFRVSKHELEDLDQGRTKTLNCVSYGRGEGQMNIQCNGVAKPAGWKARDGRLWFATTKGVIVIDPNTRVNEAPPPVFIEQVLADRHPLLLKLDAQGSSPARKEARIRIPPGRGELEFQYTAGLQTPEKNRFKYRLAGVDPEWIEAETRRTAHYNNIYPGNYRFEVIACNSDGVWNKAGASLVVLLAPHYWQTWWFRSLVVIAALGAAGGAARHLTKERMQRKLELLEQQHAIEKERSRIAQDMHDEVGARLTEIMLMSDRGQENKSDPEKAGVSLSKISSMARAVVDGLDTLVWAVNPKNDSVDKLGTYLCEYVQTFLEASAIQCRFDVPDELPAFPLSSEVRHNVLLVVKEALNNAVKHAHCSEVSLRLVMDEMALLVWLEDNGRGFETAATSALGNGLQNMEKRMRNIGGTFELASEPGRGTRIQLQIPVKHPGGRLVA